MKLLWLKNPDKQVVLLSVSETTTPPTVVAIKQAAALGLKNFSVLCCHVLTPRQFPAFLSLRGTAVGTVPLDGFIGPAHNRPLLVAGRMNFFAENIESPL